MITWSGVRFNTNLMLNWTWSWPIWIQQVPKAVLKFNCVGTDINLWYLWRDLNLKCGTVGRLETWALPTSLVTMQNTAGLLMRRKHSSLLVLWLMWVYLTVEKWQFGTERPGSQEALFRVYSVSFISIYIFTSVCSYVYFLSTAY